MSKGNGWVPIDKEFVGTLANLNRPYSMVEAMFSFTCDIDQGKEWTVNGYAKQWGWSRNKVRKFVTESRTLRGHEGDRKGTGKGHTVHFIDKGLWEVEDTKGTGRGQVEDTKRDTTIDPKILDPNPGEKPKTKKAKKTKPVAPVFNPLKFKPDFFTEELWETALGIRKRKKVENTEIALKPFVRELELATTKGFTLQECLEEYATSKWTRFKAEWMKLEPAKKFTGLSKAGQRTAAAAEEWLKEGGQQ